MKNFLAAWIPRIIMMALLIYAIRAWGVPMYKQYFVHKQEEAFVPTAEVMEGPFEIGFHEMGSLLSEKSEEVRCQVTGQIEWIVDDGVTVKKGYTICIINGADMKTQLNSAQIAYEGAKSNISRAEEALRMYKLQRQNDLEKANADYAFAETQLKLFKEELAKKKDLAKDKLVAAQEIIQAEMDEKSKEKDLKKSKMDLELLKKQVESDIKLKSRDVAEANATAKARKNDLENVQKQLSQCKITAPASGLVVLRESWQQTTQTVRDPRSGDFAYQGMPICTIPDLSRMVLSVSLTEADVPRVKAGMKALITLDSAPNRVFHGAVKSVDSVAQIQDMFGAGNPKKSFGVRISLKESDTKTLRPGMTADVEFIGKEIKDAVYVPVQSVRNEDGKSVVYVKEGKGFNRVMVKTGPSNDDYICITKGLKKGQITALVSPKHPLDRQRAAASAQAGK